MNGATTIRVRIDGFVFYKLRDEQAAYKRKCGRKISFEKLFVNNLNRLKTHELTEDEILKKEIELKAFQRQLSEQADEILKSQQATLNEIQEKIQNQPTIEFLQSKIENQNEMIALMKEYEAEYKQEVKSLRSDILSIMDKQLKRS